MPASTSSDATGPQTVGSPDDHDALARRTVLRAGVAAGIGLGAVPAVVGGAAAHGGGTPAYRFEIDPGRRRQRVQGFGASGAWWAQNLGTWSHRRRREVAKLLFSRKDGIGLSQYRYNLGGGLDETITDPWRTAESFEIERGRYDWDRDAGARWFLHAAADHGVDDFVAFVNSPPRRLTANGHTYGTPGAGSNLPRESYEEFTRYLVDIVRHFRREGIRFRFISPINEPQWGWDAPGQEGCHYEPDEVRDLTRTVIAGFQASGLRTTVSAPESGEYKAAYSEQDYAAVLLDDPQISNGIGEFAVHSYWSTDEQRALAAERMLAYPDHHLAMTEWCEMVGGRDSGMDSALVLARTVHSDLTIANATSWQYWIAVSRYDYHDGLIYTDYVEPGDEESIEETKRLWALGNYSRFIRPGADRVAVEAEQPGRTDGERARIPFVTPEISTSPGDGGTYFRIEDPAGDDHGVGTVTYPGNTVFTPGSFDLLAVEAIDGEQDVIFTLQVGADLVDPWNGSPVGYDLQVFDIYVDTGGDGFSDLLPGRRALTAEGRTWDRAVFATGRTDVAMSDVEAKVSAEMRQALFVPLEDRQQIDGDTLTIKVPKSFLGEPQPGWSYQVLVLGSEGNMAADSLRVREVLASGSDWNFGGGSDGDEDPNIIDLLVPEGMTQAQALAWTPATRTEVHMSAYVNEDGSTVIVAINESDSPQTIELSVPHRRPVLTLTPYRTSESDDLRRLQPVRLRRGRGRRVTGTTTLAPRSVYTFVTRDGD